MWIIVIFVFKICIEANGCLFIQSFLDDVLQIRESAATDKQNITCIYRYKRHHRIFAVCSYRDFHFTSLKKFQHSLLHSLTTDISLIGILFLRDLIDLINENNAMFCTLHIIVCRRQQLGNNTLYIITDISGFCKRRCISDSKRYIKKFRECLYKIGLTASGRSDHQHVGLLDFDLIHSVRRHTLIMIVNSHRHYFLSLVLTDHILVKSFFDFMWSRNVLKIQNRLLLFLFLPGLLRLLNRILETAQIDHAYIRHIQKI